MRCRGKGLTTPRLLEMQDAIEADPNSLGPADGLHRFTPQARKRLDEIAWAITDNMAEARAAKGDPVPTCGYSGRQSNRRR